MNGGWEWGGGLKKKKKKEIQELSESVCSLKSDLIELEIKLFVSQYHSYQ